MDMDMGGDERAGDTRARRRRRGVGGHAHVTHENARSRRGRRIWPTTSRGALVPKSTGIRIRESNGHTAAPLPAVVLAGCAGARSPRSDAVVDPRRSPPDRPTHMHPRHCRHREAQTARILSSTVRRHEPARPGHRNEDWRKPVLCATCGPGGRTHGSPRMLVHFRDTRRAFSCMPRNLMSPHSPAPGPRMSRDVRRLRTAVGV